MSAQRTRLGTHWLWLLVAALACAPETAAPPKRPNFILITVDTLRADHLHHAGHDSIRTPHFDRLQTESTWFANAYTTSPWTLPAVASLFTGQLSSTHGAIQMSSHLTEGALTLAELLRDAGYRTGAWSASRLIVPSRGTLQGFDHAELVMHPLHGGRAHPPGSPLRVAPARSVTTPALAWIRRAHSEPGGRPFLAYLHYMEPHTPYLCPPERARERECRSRAEALNARLLHIDWGLDDAERALVRELYRAEVERMDDELGHLMSELSATGILDDTWVVLVADHGELLGERGHYLHGKALYEPLVRIPMLFRAPDGGGRVVRTPVSLIDVAPAIAELAHVERPPAWQGRSLAPALAGKPLAPRPVVAELYMHNTWSEHRFAIIDGGDKYLLDMAGAVQRLRVAEDPGEAHPLPARTEDLERLLAEAGLVVDVRQLAPPEEKALSDEQREQLEALGYLPGAS